MPPQLTERILRKFRKSIIELDDLNHHFSVDNPIKGDIYFDGIEIEGFILSSIQEAYEAGKKDSAKDISVADYKGRRYYKIGDEITSEEIKSEREQVLEQL